MHRYINININININKNIYMPYIYRYVFLYVQFSVFLERKENPILFDKLQTYLGDIISQLISAIVI